MKRILILCALFAFLMTGCRVRTTAVISGSETSLYISSFEGLNTPDGETKLEDGSVKTVHNETADHREYDENASAEIDADASHELSSESTAEDFGVLYPDSPDTTALITDEARKTATQVIPSDSADRTGTSDNAPPAQTVLGYYSVLLQERAEKLFECKRGYVYLETHEDYLTVYKKSDLYSFILETGAYSISARLTAENLSVNAGWVLRKNPDVIVKIVGSSTLGSGVDSSVYADGAVRQLCTRDGWSGINAIRNGRIILLSEEVFENSALRMAAQIYIAKAASPAAFDDIDAEEALKSLTDEAGISGGIYIFGGRNN